jgi:hypothetical protein
MTAPNINKNQNGLADYQEDFALEFLREGADAARALVRNLSKADSDALSRHPVVAVGHALLALLDERADDQCQQGEALIGELKAISDSMRILAQRLDSSNSPDKPQAAAEQVLCDYERLKELLELAKPTFGEADYREALTRLRRLSGV